MNYFTVFDTGSAGFTIDATGILPASMITNSGIQIAGDSVTVNGITVTATGLALYFLPISEMMPDNVSPGLLGAPSNGRPAMIRTQAI